MYKFLDIFFIVFHTSLILFNLFGWCFHKLRKLNLITLLLTGSSWFILGIFYGIGYCPLTDLHFKILEKSGAANLPASYITYLFKRITKLTVNEELIDLLTFLLLIVALILSVVLNIFDYRNKASKPVTEQKF